MQAHSSRPVAPHAGTDSGPECSLLPPLRIRTGRPVLKSQKQSLSPEAVNQVKVRLTPNGGEVVAEDD